MTGIGFDVISVSRMQGVLRRTPGFAASYLSAARALGHRGAPRHSLSNAGDAAMAVVVLP